MFVCTVTVTSGHKESKDQNFGERFNLKHRSPTKQPLPRPGPSPTPSTFLTRFILYIQVALSFSDPPWTNSSDKHV